MSLLRFLAVPLAALLASVSAPALAADPFDPSDEEDRVAIEALALYPEDVRDHILEASTEADLLHDLDALQERSQRSFRDLLDPYPQDDQQDLFDLSRYPDLVQAIAEGGPKGRSELERIASRYPEDVRAAALRQGGPRHRVITRMNALLEEFDDRFDDLVADLPPRKQQAFRALLGMPEVLALLTEHGDVTILLGDAYERNLQGTRDRFADLNLQVARRNAEEADDWKEAVDVDPDLRRDYENAARDYEADTGYGAYSPPRTSVNVVVNPYPYWIGYPWWYPVSYTYYDPWYWWYPRSYWGHCGWGWGPRFYVGFGGPVWRPWFPTPYFTSWYFSGGYHHAYYPYLTDRYVSYYGFNDWDGPRVVNNVHVENHYQYNKRVVKKFVYETDRVVSRDFLRGSREERVKRIREYGKVAPELEKVQLEARRKELGKHGRRADRMSVPDRVRDEDRVATQKAGGEILRKREKDAPELVKFTRERPAAADGEVRGGKSRGGAGEKATRGAGEKATRDAAGRDGGAANVEPGSERTQGGERGKARAGERGGKDAPSVAPTEPGGKRDRAEGREGGGKDGKGAGRDAETGSAERATPTFERPGGGGKSGDAAGQGSRGRGGDAKGGDGRSRDAAPATRAPNGGGSERPASPKADGRDAPRYEVERSEPRAPKSDPGGARYQREGREQRSQPSAKREQPSARREQPSAKREQPSYAPQPEPRVERERPRGNGGGGGYESQRAQPRSEPRAASGGGREHQSGGGGGGDGGGKRKKDKEEEDATGGGGGAGAGGGGGGKRR